MAAASAAETGTVNAACGMGLTAASSEAISAEASKEGPFGKALRPQFVLVDDVVHINHGSYGAVPAVVRARRRELLDEIESYPDKFFRKEAVGRYTTVCSEIGAWLKAPVGSLVLLENATTGVNAALMSIDFKPGDKILCFQETYNACRNAVYEACRRHGAVAVLSTLPVVDALDDALVDHLVAVLERHPETRVVLLDHITSPAAVVLPVQRMCAACRARGILTIVDGAHAPGLLELDLAAIDADWYTGNLHKWAFAPRGCAVLVAAPRVSRQTRPVVTSHNWPSSSLQTRFYMQGTNDQSRFLSAPTAIAFLEGLGGVPAVAAFQQALLEQAVAAMRAVWVHHEVQEPGVAAAVPAGMEGARKRVGELLCPLGRCKGMCCIRTPLPPLPFMKPAMEEVLERLKAPAGWESGVREVLIDAVLAATGCDTVSGAATATLAPPALAGGEWAEAELDAGLPERIARVLFQVGRVQAQTFVLRGAVWLRLSAAVYNDVTDFEAVAEAIAVAVKRAEERGNVRGCLLEGYALDV